MDTPATFYQNTESFALHIWKIGKFEARELFPRSSVQILWEIGWYERPGLCSGFSGQIGVPFRDTWVYHGNKWGRYLTLFPFMLKWCNGQTELDMVSRSQDFRGYTRHGNKFFTENREKGSFKDRWSLEWNLSMTLHSEKTMGAV